MFLVVPAPAFDWGSAVEVLTPPTLKACTSAGQKATVLVFFFAPWNQSCVDFVPTFASLAARYACNQLRFARVDVARWPELAAEHGVDTSFGSVYLPSFLMFEEGQCKKRLPRGKDAAEDYKTKVDENGIIAFFELDEKLAGTNNKNK